MRRVRNAEVHYPLSSNALLTAFAIEQVESQVLFWVLEDLKGSVYISVLYSLLLLLYIASYQINRQCHVFVNTFYDSEHEGENEMKGNYSIDSSITDKLSLLHWFGGHLPVEHLSHFSLCVHQLCIYCLPNPNDHNMQQASNRWINMMSCNRQDVVLLHWCYLLELDQTTGKWIL